MAHEHINLENYLLKLAPDFSIFSLIEKYIYSRNDNFENKISPIFYFKDQEESGKENTKIRRGIFKISITNIEVNENGNETYSENPISENLLISEVFSNSDVVGVIKTFSSDNEWIVIAQSASAFKLTNDFSNCRIMGVAF